MDVLLKLSKTKKSCRVVESCASGLSWHLVKHHEHAAIILLTFNSVFPIINVKKHFAVKSLGGKANSGIHKRGEFFNI